MGAPLGPTQVDLDIAIFTAGFHYRAKLPTLGVFMTFLNDDQRPNLILREVEGIGVNASNPAAHLKTNELFVSKRACQAVALPTPPSGIQLLPRTEPLALYTSHYCIIGKFHMGPDAQVTDFSEAYLSMFIPATDARIYPLLDARPGLVDAAPYIFVHKSQVIAYHIFQ
ncbi:MAG TPA: hypothetical protein PLD47_08915 [Aggregatilineales bacterium]|nr:hypothetical protein [Anaerolineales bacterium]HRE47834.1 hypothetical protein [Aggregatilineales bacterium]